MRTQLLTPLGALIIALRANDRSQAAIHLANFNRIADEILPRLEGDTSRQANALHSAIVNVRARPGDLASVEAERNALVTNFP